MVTAAPSKRPPARVARGKRRNLREAAKKTVALTDVDKALDEARDAVKANDLFRAVKLCHTVLEADGKNARAYRTLGIVYSLLGATPQACEAYRRYLLVAPHANDKARVWAIIEKCP